MEGGGGRGGKQEGGEGEEGEEGEEEGRRRRVWKTIWKERIVGSIERRSEVLEIRKRRRGRRVE